VVGYFYALWKARAIFTVETPWGIMTNCAIKSCRSMQDESTKGASSLVVTFQKIRVSTEATVTLGEIAGRALNNATPASNNGNAALQEVAPAQEQSMLYKLLNTGQ
jgi:hypothetical protein